MASDSIEDAIAERRLTLISDAGEAREIVVRIGKPTLSPDQADFACECQIAGLGESRVRRIHGLDAFQSLQLTLRFISAMLYHHREEAQGRLYWEEPGDDMGFAEAGPSPTSGK
jgi:hypothetical protein